MVDLSKDEIRALARAVGIEIEEPLLTDVTYDLNGLMEVLEEHSPPELEGVEPLPIIAPHLRRADGRE